MRSLKLLIGKFSFFLLCVTAVSTLCAGQTIDFTQLVFEPYQERQLPDGYGGLHWSNFAAFRTPGCATVKYEFSYTGYCRIADVTGKPDLAYIYGEYGKTRQAEFSSETPFVFESAVLAAAWNNDVVLTVSGYRNGLLVNSTIVPLHTGFVRCQSGPSCELSDKPFPTSAPFGWFVDKVTMTATGGYSDGIGEYLFPGWHQPHVIVSSLRVHKGSVQVPIDVKPGSPINIVSLANEGTLKIAFLGSAAMDARDIDISSILTGRGAAPIVDGKVHYHDVNKDGTLDLVYRVETRSLDLQAMDTQLCAAGQTFTGLLWGGCDAVRIVDSRWRN